MTTNQEDDALREIVLCAISKLIKEGELEAARELEIEIELRDIELMPYHKQESEIAVVV